MLSLFKNKSFLNGVFSTLTSLVSKLARPVANMITGYFTRKATPEAQAYATKVTNKLCDKIPGIVADLATTGLSIGTKGFSPAAGAQLVGVAFDAFTNKKNSLRQLVKAPYKAYKAYNKYQSLNKTARAA